MINVRQDLFTTAVDEAVVLTNREAPDYQRTFVLENLDASSDLTIRFESSSDGSTWAAQQDDDGNTASFTLSAATKQVKKFTQDKQLRIVAYGAVLTDKLAVALMSVYDGGAQWANPLL